MRKPIIFDDDNQVFGTFVEKVSAGEPGHVIIKYIPFWGNSFMIKPKIESTEAISEQNIHTISRTVVNPRPGFEPTVIIISRGKEQRTLSRLSKSSEDKLQQKDIEIETLKLKLNSLMDNSNKLATGELGIAKRTKDIRGTNNSNKFITPDLNGFED